MLVIGMTGGIGSGKSAVGAAFARRGVPVIDTDELAREVVQPGQPALAEIIAQFGPDCRAADGTLDRAHLRRQVFADPSRRRQLEALLHPRIRAALRDRLAALQVPYCLVAVPLLVETGLRDWFQRILVVDVAEALQVERVMARDGVDRAQAEGVLAAQASRAERRRLADDVLDNSGSLAALDVAVEQLHRKYLALARQDGDPA